MLGVFWNPQDLLLMMGTKIFKIDAEMAEKIEVEVGTLNTEINLESSLKIKTTASWEDKDGL